MLKILTRGLDDDTDDLEADELDGDAVVDFELGESELMVCLTADRNANPHAQQIQEIGGRLAEEQMRALQPVFSIHAAVQTDVLEVIETVAK